MLIHFCLILSDSSKILKEITRVFIIHKIFFSHKAFLFLLFMFWKEISVVQRNGAAQKNLPPKEILQNNKRNKHNQEEKTLQGGPWWKRVNGVLHRKTYIF